MGVINHARIRFEKHDAGAIYRAPASDRNFQPLGHGEAVIPWVTRYGGIADMPG